MKIVHICLVLILCLLVLQGKGQIGSKDSTSVRNLDKEARSIMMTNKDQAILLCDEAITLSQKDSSLLLTPLTTKALIFFQHGEVETSVGLMDEVIAIAQKIQNNSKLSSAYRNMGQIKEYSGVYDEALEYYILSNDAYQKDSEYEGHPNLLMTIGDLYFRLEDNSGAKENYEKGYALAPIWQSDKLLAEFETKLAKVFYTQNELDSAFSYASRSNEFYANTKRPTVNDPAEILADISVARGNLTKGVAYYETVLVSLIEKEETRRTAYIAQKLGELKVEQKNYIGAKKNLELALQSNEKLGSPDLAENYEMLALIHSKTGSLGKAFEFQKKYSETYKELLNSEKLQQINDLQIKYETEKKERENERLSFELSIEQKENEIAQADLSKRNYLIGGIVGLCMVLLATLYLYFNRKKVVQRNEMLRLEQKLLKTQMNPHFISNALVSAQGYILDNNPREANGFLTKLAKLTRLILENSRKESISLEEEITTLQNYLMIQQKRYNNFDYELVVEDSLDPEDVWLPPMLTQPFVENAIEHGMQNLSYKGLLQIVFRPHKGKLNISIADNGSGIDPNKANNTHISLSSVIVKERLQNLSAYYKEKLDFSISNNYTSPIHGEGTKIVLSLPLLN